MSLVIFIKYQLHAFFPYFFLYTHSKRLLKWCCILFLFFFRVYRPNIVVGTVLMVHQPLTPPLQQTLEPRGLPRPDLRPELDTPSCQSLENTVPTNQPVWDIKWQCSNCLLNLATSVIILQIKITHLVHLHHVCLFTAADTFLLNCLSILVALTTVKNWAPLQHPDTLTPSIWKTKKNIKRISISFQLSAVKFIHTKLHESSSVTFITRSSTADELSKL